MLDLKLGIGEDALQGDSYEFMYTTLELNKKIFELNEYAIALENLTGIQEVLTTHGSTTVLESIVGNQLKDVGIELSIEGIGSAIKSAANTIWKKIKEFFVWLKSWFVKSEKDVVDNHIPHITELLKKDLNKIYKIKYPTYEGQHGNPYHILDAIYENMTTVQGMTRVRFKSYANKNVDDLNQSRVDELDKCLEQCNKLKTVKLYDWETDAKEILKFLEHIKKDICVATRMKSWDYLHGEINQAIAYSDKDETTTDVYRKMSKIVRSTLEAFKHIRTQYVQSVLVIRHAVKSDNTN